MSLRKKFKHLRGKVKETLGLGNSPLASTSSLPITPTNPVPIASLRAHSHSPAPRSDAQLASPHVESRVKIGNDNVQLPTPPYIRQAQGPSDPRATNFTRSRGAQAVSLSDDPMTKSDVEAKGDTIRTARLLPDIQSNPPIPAPAPTPIPISRYLDNSQDAAVQSIVSPPGPEVAGSTNDPAIASLVSLPTPGRGVQNDTTTATDGSQDAFARTADLLPSVHDAASVVNLVPLSLDVGDQIEHKPLDAISLPQAVSTTTDAIPNPHNQGERNETQQTCPQPDTRVTSRVTLPMVESTHGDTDSTSTYRDAPSLPDSQASLPVVVIAPESDLSIPADTRPAVSTPVQAKTKLTLANGAWKSFNGFRRLLGGIANEVGPLKLVMDELGGLIGMYEDAASARTDYASLKAELEELFSMLSTHFSGNVPPAMTTGINNLCIAIETELDRISTKEDRRTARRLAEAEQDLDEVMECYWRIEGHLKRLNLNVDLSMWKIVDEQASETRLGRLAPSLSACYNSAEALQVGRRECTPETRKKVLADLSHWRRDITQQNMYWLNGMAGTGKTTIASSLCAMLDQSHELGASFFCTRLLPECRDVKLILPTVAYQLARLSRPFYHALSLALQVDPDLHTKAIPVQLQGLIIDPLRKAAPALPEHLVVVIDALDECEDTQATGILLEALARKATDLPLKVFVSSRPEPQIRERIGGTISKLILHELEASIVKQDIKLYFQTELSELCTSVSDTDLAALVERAGVLFIYAATVVRYIKSVSSSSRRRKRVREVLEVKSSGSSRTKNDIDALYSAILASAFASPELNDEEINAMKLVLDTVVCAQEPLTVLAIAGLLGLGDASLVEDALEPLWSVLHISGADKLVTTLHASFPDYMLDPTRSKQHGCQSDEHNGRLVEWCFDRINRNECQVNICGLESSFVFDEDIPDLDKRAQVAIPQDLWYACRYWAAHLKQGRPSADRSQKLRNFVADRLLLWMEVLNLKKQMNLGALIFETVELWCEKESASQETKDLVHDAWRFVTMFATNDVSRSTAHLYISMLASWPRVESDSKSVISPYIERTTGLNMVGGTGMARRQLALLGVFSAEVSVNSLAFSPDGMRIVSGSDDGTVRVWDAQTGEPLPDPLEGHTDSVRSVAFSPDGMHIVSGSDDRTIRVWDANTGNPVLDPLEGHTNSVKSVAFSPDGMRIVSGSNDSTVRVWDAQTGTPLLDPLKGHADWVCSVAFSPDGMRIVSGSTDRSIRMWDAQTGWPVLDQLRGHANSVNSVAFSSDGMQIVSGSNDKTVRTWDAQTGDPILDPLRGHTDSVKWAAFSPDGMRIVSGSDDETIRVWDAQTGKPLLDPLKGHTDSVKSVAFSPDGMRIVSGSDDETIRVWDANTGKPVLDPLEGHTNSVYSVVFSCDSLRIVSGSDDKTIRVWDAQTGRPLLNPLTGHINSFRSVAFSPDGMRIVSGSDDSTVRVWDTHTGKSILDPLEGHTESVRSVAFSLNGMRIVSGSDDKTVRVWDAQPSRAPLGPLRGHTDSVRSVAFSPDGMRIVSGSDDRTIRVWDANTGNPVLDPLEGHTNSVKSVAFSPDGMRIVSGSNDSTVRVWDAQTGTPLLDPLKGHADWVCSVAFSPDGMRIVSGSDDKTVGVWDARTGKPLLDPLQGHTGRVNSVAFSLDGMRIVSGSTDKSVRVWDVQTGQPLLAPLEGYMDSVCSVAFSLDGMRIVSGSDDSTIRVWAAQTGKPLLGPLEGHTKSVKSVAFSPDGMRIVSGSQSNTVQLWDAHTGKPVLDSLKGYTDSVKSIAFSPDGVRIVSGSYDSTIRVWDAQTGKPLLNPLEGHTSSVNTVAFSSDSLRIASGSDDKTVRMWDARTGECLLGELRGHTDWVYSVAFSPDGMRIVSGSDDKTVRVWDAQTGNSILDPLKGHTDSVKSVAFSADGMRIVSGSDDKTIRVWDANTGKPVLEPLEGHTSWVNSVSFSPDGMRIVSGSDDKTIRMWDLNSLMAQVSPPPTDPFISNFALPPQISCLIPQQDTSATQLTKSPFRHWTIDERGWIRDQARRPLLWLPSDLRHRLVLSKMVFLISTEGSVELDFNNAKLGESWVECYVPCPRLRTPSSFHAS